MSSVTPGRETDAAVARALGYVVSELRFADKDGDGGDDYTIYENIATGERMSGLMYSLGMPVIGRNTVPRYSASPADALAALEETGEPWGLVYQKGGKYGCNIGPSHTWHYGETLCTAICAAILQLPRGEGKP